MKRLTVGVVAALVLVALLFGVMGGQAQAQERAPAVTKQKTLLLYPATQVSAGSTTYTSSPRELSPGVDASAVAGWANVDLFATVDISGTGFVTVTLQYSADGVNWADADYEYATFSIRSAGSIHATCAQHWHRPALACFQYPLLID